MVKIGMAFGTVLILALATWTVFGAMGQSGRPTVTGLGTTLDPMAWPESPNAVAFAVIGDFGTPRHEPISSRSADGPSVSETTVRASGRSPGAATNQKSQEKAKEAQINHLYRHIGQLKVERDFLSERSGL